MGEVVGQHRQVAVTLTQWRCHDLQHVQAIVEIFTEAFFLDRGLKVDVGRRQNPHIHRNRLAAAHPLDVFFLKKTQQVGL
ncbi:hypothetical protein D3C86_1285600 [compost metagenome]